MSTPRLVAKVDAEPDGRFLVRSPAVGGVDGVPGLGVYLNPSEGMLTLTILGRRHVLQLPRTVRGSVVEQLVEDTSTPVSFGQPLVRLSPLRDAAEHGSEGRDRRGAEQGAGDLIAVSSPSDGVFYRRPTPDTPPYVEEGATITTGSVLGLVEVMKCFNQIAYGGTDLPERAKVERVLVEDAAEVAYGQTLFLVRAV
jgi:biotin carboxyl carrier protein